MPVVRHRTPSLRSYPMWLASRLFLKPVLAMWPLSGPGLEALWLIDRILAAGPKPRGVQRSETDLAGCGAELILPEGDLMADDSAILYLHGGAFVVGGLGTHRSIAARLSRQTALPVYSLEYRQLPQAGVGTSVADAVAAYRELLTERGFRHIIVAGDSAGGFLAAKVIEAAAARGLPQPVGYIGYSPLLDLNLTDDPKRTSRNDAYIPRDQMARLRPRFFRGPLAMPGKASILDVDPAIFPPTLLITASEELLEADSLHLVAALDEAGVPAEGHSYAWQIHAFPVMSARHPETLQAIDQTAAFVAGALTMARAATRTTRSARDPRAVAAVR